MVEFFSLVAWNWEVCRRETLLWKHVRKGIVCLWENVYTRRDKEALTSRLLRLTEVHPPLIQLYLCSTFLPGVLVSYCLIPLISIPLWKCINNYKADLQTIGSLRFIFTATFTISPSLRPIARPIILSEQSIQRQTSRHKRRCDPPEMPPPPLPHYPFQLRLHLLLPSPINPLQFPLHRSNPIIDWEDKHLLPPGCLHQHKRRRAVHFPLRSCVRVRVVSC